MDVDDIDHRLLASVLADGSRSQRDHAKAAGVSAPTAAARLKRLGDLGLVGAVRADVDVAQLGTLVLVLAPPGDAERLGKDERVFSVHRTQENRCVALALLRDADELRELHRAFPSAETHVLTERLASRAPRLGSAAAKVACSQCGKPIEGKAIHLKLGGRAYVACCPTCRKELERRFNKAATGR